MENERQGLPLLTAIVGLILTLVVLQLWILAATIEALLGGDASIALPAALAQLALFAVNGGLLLFVLAFDRRLRGGRSE